MADDKRNTDTEKSRNKRHRYNNKNYQKPARTFGKKYLKPNFEAVLSIWTDIEIEGRALISVTGIKQCDPDGDLRMNKPNAYVCLLCGLFNDAFSSSDYIASNDRLVIQ
jgi:hypothetical protein